jgi:SAM-dependent methyltransferase
MNLDTRQPHAVLDLPSRRLKGLKIERLLGLAERQQPMRLLEIGTGSGGIAHYFATHPTLRCEVTAVDVVDQRLIHDGYDFRLVHDTVLPFADNGFDVVLSNHVIEHVGDRAAQLAHLRELHRVLAPDGVAYLAVPNRWMLVEPHYRLAFLSWLPRPLRTPYLRLMRRGERYDCEPLTVPQLDSLLSEAGFAWCHLEVEALREMLEIEDTSNLLVKLLDRTPDWTLRRLQALIPTLICRLKHPIGEASLSVPGDEPHRRTR